MMISCQCGSAGQSSGDWFEKVLYGAPESGWPSLDSNWQCYYILGSTTKLSMPFQILGLYLYLKAIFLVGLGLTVTEINIKKVQKQDFKNIKNVKGCRDGMSKSMQTR